MSDFSYTVSKKDTKGLSEIFLKKAKAEGFDGKNVDWTAVMSVFDKIQQEEIEQGQSLFSGGTDKTRAGWRNSYIIKAGDKIELSESQVDEIYNAMGFKKAETVSTPEQKAPQAEQKTESADTTKTQSDTVKKDIPAAPPAPKVEADSAKTQTPKASAPVMPDTSAKSDSTQTSAPKDTASTSAESKSASDVQIPDWGNATVTIDSAADQRPIDSSTHIDFKPVSPDTLQAAKGAKTPNDYHEIKTDNCSGTYKISKDENGSYNLFSTIQVDGTPAESKFFKSSDIKYDKETKEYSLRDIKSTDEGTVYAQSKDEVRTIAAEQAIYVDLAKRQSSGDTLSNEEQSFMTTHTKNLKAIGLQVNEKNDIVEIPQTPQTASQPAQTNVQEKKSFWQRFKDLF